MGLLAVGTPLQWDQSKPYADHVRWHGIAQFLHTWDRLKDRHGDDLLWGDEIEYMVISLDKDTKSVKLSLRQSEILEKLNSVVGNLCEDSGNDFAIPRFHPEYGRYMLESTPGAPYTGSLHDLISVEKNMRYRRTLARQHLKSNEVPISFTSFPRLGAPGVFTEPYYDPANAVSSHSFFLPEEITNPHVRFPTLTANIRSRRGSKVAINLPLFFDSNTPRPFRDPTIPWDRKLYPEDEDAKNGAAMDDHIYMDAMGFGMGCCCLQITFQSCNVTEAQRIYDALVPIGPIMLAMTAASPFWRGYIADVDCRWNVIAGSVDDRTEEERGLKPLNENKFRIPKSRYDSVDMYISEDKINRAEYNDVDAPFDQAVYDRMREHGIDDLLSKHMAHLFIRDPLVVFNETIDQDDTLSMDHFENIQSTNWQTMRFKPPPPNSPIGWRVEFRSMEVQITDFENAAFSVFMVLLSRAILSFGLNFYIPMSKVDANMKTAQERDAARKKKFFFRKDIFPSLSPLNTPFLEEATIPSDIAENEAAASQTFKKVAGLNRARVFKERALRNCFPAPPSPLDDDLCPVDEEYELMSMYEIMNGKGDYFPGLLGLVYAFLETLEVDEQTDQKLRKYLDLIRQRSTGSLLTLATWMRNFVRSHPAYKMDSVINEEVTYDLMVAIDEIERGVRKASSLLPGDYVGGSQDEGCL